MNLKRAQSGYMMEVPLIMVAVAILLAIAVPNLPGAAGKALLVAGALAFVAGLYYMVVAPGWQPGRASRLGRLWRLLVFLGIAIPLSLAVGVHVARG